MMLSPAFGWILRHAPFPGLVLVAVLFWFNMDSYLVQRNEMAIMFYIGGMAAVQKWNLKRLDQHAGLCLVSFLALCGVVVAFKIGNTTFLRFIAPVLIWPATSLIAHTNAGAWIARRSKYSFFVFLLHAPLLLLSYMLFKQFIPQGLYTLYWFATPFLVTGLLITTYKIGIAISSAKFELAFGITPSTPSIAGGGGLGSVAAATRPD